MLRVPYFAIKKAEDKKIEVLAVQNCLVLLYSCVRQVTKPLKCNICVTKQAGWSGKAEIIAFVNSFHYPAIS